MSLPMITVKSDAKEFFSKLKPGDYFTYLPVAGFSVEIVTTWADEHGLVTRYCGPGTAEFRKFTTDVFYIERRCMPLAQRMLTEKAIIESVSILLEAGIPMSIIDRMKTGALELIYGINELQMTSAEMVKKVTEAADVLIATGKIPVDVANLMKETALRRIVKIGQ